MSKKGPKIKFYEKSHIYKLGKQKLTSVTTFLGGYFKKFEGDKIAKFLAYRAKSQGISGQGVRYWKQQWKDAATHGTVTHKLIEDYIEGIIDKEDIVVGHLDENGRPLEERDVVKALEGIKFYDTIKDNGVATTEKIIYDGDLGLAGMIDLLVENHDKSVSLYDWKTNKAITQEGYRGAKAKVPLKPLPDCNYTKYCLQLSTYAYMLELQGKRIGELQLIHLKEGEHVVYDIPYMKNEVMKLLAHSTEEEDEQEIKV